MKKRLVISLGILSLLAFVAFPFISNAGKTAAQEDIAKHPACPYCGMDRQKFAHSRIYIVYDDGTTIGTCALHCAAIDLSINIDKTPKSIMVGDFNTKELIDAEKAVWVLGGSKMGVMTKRAKWAFVNQQGADDFIKQNGGEIVAFEPAVKAAYEDMYQDTRMIREKRKMKRMKKD